MRTPFSVGIFVILPPDGRKVLVCEHRCALTNAGLSCQLSWDSIASEMPPGGKIEMYAISRADGKPGWAGAGHRIG